MAVVTLEGIYENGRVKLIGKPQGVKKANVTVIFSPTELEETQNNPPHPNPRVRTKNLTAPRLATRYPHALQEEYKALIQKKLHRTLTEEEAACLETVRAEINLRDRQSEAWTAWESRAQEIEAKLIALQQELESYPDA